MTITIIIQIFVLAALLFVAAELYVLIRELGLFMRRFPVERENRDSASSGQTINVNLSSVPQAGQVSHGGEGKALYSSSLSGESTQTGQAGEMAESSAAGATPESQPKTAKKTGALSVECPRCHTENSSYRVECFNCGNPL
jgi:hypothetical protein